MFDFFVGEYLIFEKSVEDIPAGIYWIQAIFEDPFSESIGATIYNTETDFRFHVDLDFLERYGRKC